MKTNISIAMIGGRGFVGQEIISILNNHPTFMLTKVFSKTAEDEVGLQEIFKSKVFSS